MKRWLPAFLIAMLACVPILFARSSDPSLLRDTDTQALLVGIRARHAPLSWFAGDWPLGNHFYRPLPTLSFEMDDALGGGPATFGLSNSLLCVACTLLLFWFVREFTNSPAISAACAVLFGLWQVDLGGTISYWLQWAWIPVAIVGIVQHRLRIGPVIGALLALSFLLFELQGHSQLQFRMIAWLPGRTASVMTLFCLVAMACYCRFERLVSKRLPLPPATALDPNQPMKEEAMETGSHPWMWAVLSLLATAAALASYEQAVMLPAVVLGLAVGFRLLQRHPHWLLHTGYWILLVAYLVLRHAVVPSTVSGYQAQQFRHGPGVLQSMFDYVLPAVNLFDPMLTTVATGLTFLFIGLFWESLWGIAANLWGLRTVLRSKQWAFALTAFVLSFLAYLPMAWLKPFDHYHYWPMAIRTLFVVTLGAAAIEAALTAVSPPAVQAPQRLNPAPGSLLHR